MSEVSASDPQVPEASPSEGALEVPARRRRDGAEDDDDGSRKRLLLLVPLVMAAAAIVALVLVGMQDKGMYSKPVDTLVAERAKFVNKPVRAEGNLVHGSLVKRESPCEYRFTIEKNGSEIPVTFAGCVVPDTFRDVPGMDVGVTVEGQLRPTGQFEATQVLAKCPSKYEMKQKAANGEKMPHAGGSAPTSPAL
ncbi:MAG TPA: cytochrome c maturation protein CcmE [Labilithrix sp.]|nr:cytochrome c maturation protein CcmE [Labilithrix sp.]